MAWPIGLDGGDVTIGKPGGLGGALRHAGRCATRPAASGPGGARPRGQLAAR